MVCFGCGVILPEEDFDMIEDEDGDATALECPECGSHDTEELS